MGSERFSAPQQEKDSHTGQSEGRKGEEKKGIARRRDGDQLAGFEGLLAGGSADAGPGIEGLFLGGGGADEIGFVNDLLIEDVGFVGVHLLGRGEVAVGRGAGVPVVGFVLFPGLRPGVGMGIGGDADVEAVEEGVFRRVEDGDGVGLRGAGADDGLEIREGRSGGDGVGPLGLAESDLQIAALDGCIFRPKADAPFGGVSRRERNLAAFQKEAAGGNAVGFQPGFAADGGEAAVFNFQVGGVERNAVGRFVGSEGEGAVFDEDFSALIADVDGAAIVCCFAAGGIDFRAEDGKGSV